MKRGWALAVLGAVLALALIFARPPEGLRLWQERVFDRVLLALPLLPDRRAVVVDIGAQDDLGRVWDRISTARLSARIAASQPRVVGFDLLFAGSCDRPETAALARGLQALPAVLGFLLTDRRGPPLPDLHLAVAGGAELWQAEGADLPCDSLPGQRAAMVLMGDADALVRRVPVGVAVDGVAQASLPVALAAAVGGGQVLAGPGWLRIATQGFVAEGGSLRIQPSPPAIWAARRVDAAELLAGRADLPQGAMVLVGSSLPQRGGLRPTAASPVAPSVQIMADAVEGLVSGHLPARAGWAAWLEAGFVLLAGLAGFAMMARLRPALAAAGCLAAAGLWAAGALTLWHAGGWLVDPVTPGLALLLVLLAALVARATLAARAERALRARMGQVMPAALVARVAANPGLLRLEGEAREITALFTDIEGFSIATAEMGPSEMVARLDAYFTLTCAIVLRHGGMIDKLVGDSIHALFNAPLDQPGHEAAALVCAREILSATEAFRAAHGGFGRTRIGLEVGQAVLGDVGFGGKIDYTAHGAAVNLAARLQEVNKQFGTQICAGPELGRRLGLVPLGEIEVRSFGRLTVFGG